MKNSIQILLLLLLVICHSYGQVSDSVAQRATPFTASEIPSNLVEMDLLIEEVVNAQQPTEKYLLITDSLDLFQDSLNMVIQRIDTIPTGVALQILEIQRKGITQFSTPLNSWNDFLESRIEDFESLLEEMEESRGKWEVTLESLSETETSASIAAEIKTRLDSLVHTEAMTDARVNEIIEYEVRINQMKQRIDQTVDKLDDYLDNRLWARDSAPLWALESDSLSDKYGLQQLKKILVANKESIENYYNLYRPSFYLHLAIFSLLVLLFFRLRRSSKKYSEYEDLTFLYHALSRPVLSALLVSLLFSTWIYSNVPRALAEAVVILALVPVVGIFYGYVHPVMRMPLVAMGFIYLFNYLQSLLPIGTLFQRLLMLVESMMVIAFSVWVSRLFRTVKPRIPYGWLRALVHLIPIVAFFLVASLLANVAGSVRLSRTLLSGIIESTTLALIYFGAFMVMSNIVAFTLRNPYAHVFNLIRENFELMGKRLNFFFQYAAFFLWVRSTLNIFGLLDILVGWFAEIWSFGTSFGNMTITVGGILGFFIIILVAWWMARVLQLLLERELFVRLNVSKGIPHAISTTIFYVFIGLGFLLAVSYAGFDLNQISLVIGALGVGIGFGLQNVISNFVSGLILTFERPINVGDTVEVGPLMGNVTAMGLRSSKVKTFDGSEVIVPNSNLVSKEVINWTLSDNRRRLAIPINAAYGSDPHQVMDIMLEVVKNHPKILDYPFPMPLFEGFGENSLSFRVLFWVHFDESLKVKSDIAIQLYDALTASGIEVPIPQRVITMKPGSDENIDH